MKSKIIYFTALLLIGLLGFKFYLSSHKVAPSPLSQPAKVHFHAGFIVFNNSKKVDFSGLKYMEIEPCKLNEEKNEPQTPDEMQHEKAHLHDSVGDVVHSHVEGAKWGDLFTNINYPLDYSQVTAFINGQEVNNIQDTLITPYDSLVIFIGKVDTNLLNQAVTIDHIKQIESKSETCGS